jgi:hypothetical protein
MSPSDPPAQGVPAQPECTSYRKQMVKLAAAAGRSHSDPHWLTHRKV